MTDKELSADVVDKEIIKLLPCPFCGGRAREMTGMGEWWIMCDICQASAGMESSFYHAVEQWNRRYKA